jgi:hypothetical protein
MPKLRPPGRFLLRGSVLLTGLLTAWWFFLQNPMLFLLRNAAEAVGGLVLDVPSKKLVTEAPNGDWTFEIPIEFWAPGASPDQGQVQFHSIDFDMARADVSAFTFSLPVYWAIMLAAPGVWRNRRALLLGSVSIALAEVVLLMICVEIFAHKAAMQMSQSHDAVANWLLPFGNYMLVLALPYLAPVVVAVWLHRDLREQILGWPNTHTDRPPRTPAFEGRRPAGLSAGSRTVPRKT